MLESMKMNDYVNVKKGTLEDCLTCPLCFELFKEATTVCPCLHTFCKECIYQKLEDDQTNCCPMCNIYLGCSPLEKLRPDNNLQDLRLKIFSVKNRSKVMKMTTTPTRKKKRSLSSLAIDPTTTKTSLSRGKMVLEKPKMSREIINKPQYNNTNVKEENTHFGPSSSHACSNKLPIGLKKQRLSGDEESSRVSRTTIGLSLHSEPSNRKDKHVNWEPLSVLAEAANKRESRDALNWHLLGLPAFTSKSEDKTNGKDSKNMKRRARESIPDQNINDFTIKKSLIPEERPKCPTNCAAEFFSSTEQTNDALTINEGQGGSLKRMYPVWFTLLACQKKGNPYPQIPKAYIRIKDGNLPASYVNRYLAQKLNLQHESEVEVMCCGQTPTPNATLSSLVDIWLQFISQRNGPITRSNSSVQNFVMVLTYRRKVLLTNRVSRAWRN